MGLAAGGRGPPCGRELVFLARVAQGPLFLPPTLRSLAGQQGRLGIGPVVLGGLGVSKRVRWVTSTPGAEKNRALTSPIAARAPNRA